LMSFSTSILLLFVTRKEINNLPCIGQPDFDDF
jgi:hypothetical protein